MIFNVSYQYAKIEDNSHNSNVFWLDSLDSDDEADQINIPAEEEYSL